MKASVGCERVGSVMSAGLGGRGEGTLLGETRLLSLLQPHFSSKWEGDNGRGSGCAC